MLEEIFPQLALLLFLTCIILGAFLFFFYKKAQSLESRFSELEFKKQSQSVKYGKLTEQWIPFSDQFPFPAEQFRFLGTPVDGIAFTDEGIVFCEFKTATSKLSEKQKRIKEMVKKKMVDWFELRVS